jgi:hypothetical protein
VGGTGEDCIMTSFRTCKLHGTQVEEDEIGETCSAHRCDKKSIQNFSQET